MRMTKWMLLAGATFAAYAPAARAAPERNADRVPDDAGLTLSVLPTADAAPAAEVSVTGEIRTALLYTDFGDDDNADVDIRARLVIRGKADTAVGEVGGYFRLETRGGGDFSDYDEDVNVNKAYGWWEFAPNWQLLAGYEDNTATLQTSWDWIAATAPTRTFGPSYLYNEQIRLTYTSGPLSAAIALEDPDNFTGTSIGQVGFADANGNGVEDPGEAAVLGSFTDSHDKSDIPNVQGYLMYSSDSLTAQLVGLWQSDDVGDHDDWAVGGGAALGLAEDIQITAAAVVGEGSAAYAANLAPITADEEFWAGSIGLLAKLADDTRIELGVGYEDYDAAGSALGYGGGLYWDPVSQVTLGFGATYIDFDDAFVDDDGITAIEDDSLEVFVGTWLRFP